MIELSNRELIKEASQHLKRASHFLRMAESGNKPFRIGKIINMMAKATYDDHIVLQLILGEVDIEDVDLGLMLITHAVKLFQVELEDNPNLLSQYQTSEETQED